MDAIATDARSAAIIEQIKNNQDVLSGRDELMIAQVVYHGGCVVKFFNHWTQSWDARLYSKYEEPKLQNETYSIIVK